MICPSCGEFPVKRLAVICELCQAVMSAPNPEHVRTIVPRVMDEIEQTRKDAAA